MNARVPRFQRLVQEKHLTNFAVFDLHLARHAELAAKKEGRDSLANVTVSRRTFTRWCTEGVRTAPHTDVGLVLEHMFGMPVSRIFELVEPPTGPSTELMVEECAPADHPETEFDEPQTIRDDARLLAMSNVDPAILLMARSTIAGLVGRYELLGPQQLVGEARLLRRMLHTLLAGHQPPGTRTELFRAAGQVSGLLSYMATNSGRPDASQAYGAEALGLAREIGDLDLEMWILGTRSLGLYYQGQYDLADEAAAAGVALSPGHPQAIRLLVNGRARALSRQGHRTQALEAVSKALELTDTHEVPAGLTSCISFEPYSAARTLANAVTAHLSLGDSHQVLAYAGELDPMLERSDSAWSRALVGLDVATALLQQERPEVEMAMHLGREALGGGTTPPIRSVWLRGVELYERAASWRDEPAVREYADSLRAWRTRPTAGTVAAGSGTRRAL